MASSQTWVSVTLAWSKSGTLTTTNAGKEMEQEVPFTDDENAKWYSHFGKQLSSVLQNQIVVLPGDLAIVLLGICPKN